LTGDELADHTKSPLWLGEAQPLDIDVIRRHVEQGAREGVSVL